MDRAKVDALESLVDREGLRAVLAALAEIAQGKADHIRENWQDGRPETLSREWEKAGQAIDRAAERAPT